MIDYTWKILEIYTDFKSVRYFVSATDGVNVVESEGNQDFSEGTVNIPFEQIKESNLIEWVIKETTKDDSNAIKLNLKNQLEALRTYKKVAFPWEADTFTIG